MSPACNVNPLCGPAMPGGGMGTGKCSGCTSGAGNQGLLCQNRCVWPG